MNKVSKVVTIMGVAVMLLGFNATAGSLLGGDIGFFRIPRRNVKGYH
jgi:hypothetical protein